MRSKKEIIKIVDKIIPPADYSHRNGFTNTDIIDQLTESEKQHVEESLIYKLLNETEVDMLVVTTLAYMKSKKASPILKEILTKHNNELGRIIISCSIFEIEPNENMIDLAIEALKKLDNPNDPYYISKLTESFFSLLKLKSDKVNKIIDSYTHHSEYLISYNAKRALSIL